MVTDMPKPDLLCLVQLLDGTIETFRVSVNKHKLTRNPPLALNRLHVAPACFFFAPLMIAVSFEVSLSDSTASPSRQRVMQRIV